MKRKVIVISVIFILIFTILAVFSCFRRNAGMEIWDKYLVDGSVWEYQNNEKDLEMILNVKENLREVKYKYKEKEGTWIMVTRYGNGRWRGVDFVYLMDDSGMQVWSGFGKIEKDRIIIKYVHNNEEIEEGVKNRAFPKEVEEETIPDTIKEVELRRVE